MLMKVLLHLSWSVQHWTKLDFKLLDFTVQHWTGLDFTILDFTVQHCNGLDCSMQHWTGLFSKQKCTELHYKAYLPTMHCNLLQYVFTNSRNF